MTGFFLAGGVWNIVITLVGLAAIGCGVQQHRNLDREYGPLLLGLTAATFLVSVVAYGVGKRRAVGVVDLADPTNAAAKMAVGMGYASTALGWGALMATLSAVVGGTGAQRARSAR